MSRRVCRCGMFVALVLSGVARGQVPPPAPARPDGPAAPGAEAPLEKFLADLRAPLPAPPPAADRELRDLAQAWYDETRKALDLEFRAVFGPGTAGPHSSHHTAGRIESATYWMERSLSARLEMSESRADTITVLAQQRRRLLAVEEVVRGLAAGAGSSVDEADVAKIRAYRLEIEYRLAKAKR